MSRSPPSPLFQRIKFPITAYMEFSGHGELPRILHLDGMTLEDVQEVEPCRYRIQDIIASLVYQRAGEHGLSALFSECTGPDSQIRSWHFPAGAFKLVLIYYGLPSRRIEIKARSVARQCNIAHVSLNLTVEALNCWPAICCCFGGLSVMYDEVSLGLAVNLIIKYALVALVKGKSG